MTVPQRYERTADALARPKGCRNKVRYSKRKQALSALNAMRAKNPGDPAADRLEVYRCRHGCRGWHVGHSSL